MSELRVLISAGISTLLQKFREFKPRPIHGIMVARDRFKYRFKISELRPDSLSFLENYHKMSLKRILNRKSGE